MTLQDWGAIGELVGGVAVIATLIYLAVQLRQYALGINSATFHSSMQGFNQLNTMFVSDPSLADVYNRGMGNPASLSASERHQFVWLMRCYVNIYENLYQQFARGACPEEYWVRYARELKQTLDSPGGRQFRKTNTTYEDLYAYVDRMPPNAEPAYDMSLAPEQSAEQQGASPRSL